MDTIVCATHTTLLLSFLLKVNSDGTLVITADDFGGVKLFNAPCVVEDAPSLRHAAHSSHVMGIRFLFGKRSSVAVERLSIQLQGMVCGIFFTQAIPYSHLAYVHSDETRAVSLGGQDHAICQWKITDWPIAGGKNTNIMAQLQARGWSFDSFGSGRRGGLKKTKKKLENTAKGKTLKPQFDLSVSL